MTRLHGKVAVITGGASGIGESAVRRFVAEGARVVIADVQDAQGTALAAELGDAVVFVHTDVSREEDVKGAIDTAVERFGRLDCLVNNAGVTGALASVEGVEAASWDRTQAILVNGPMYGIKHAAPVMKRQRSGSIINIASLAALRNGYGPLGYSVAKAAVAHLTRCTAADLGEYNVRVNAISPGAIVTPLAGAGMGVSREEILARLPLQEKMYARAQPIPRAGKPEDIAAAMLFLASDDASFVNGHDLVIDGGITCGLSNSQAQLGMKVLLQAFAAPQQTASVEPIRIKNFHHVALSTGNMDKVFAFYRDLLGMEVTLDIELDNRESSQRNFPESEFHESAAWMAHMKTRFVNMKVPGGHANFEVFQYMDPAGKDVEGKELHQYDHRLVHFGLEVEDIFPACERLKAAGVEFHWYPAADVGMGTRAVYMYDFEGNTVELIQNPEMGGLEL